MLEEKRTNENNFQIHCHIQPLVCLLLVAYSLSMNYYYYRRNTESKRIHRLVTSDKHSHHDVSLSDKDQTSSSTTMGNEISPRLDEFSLPDPITDVPPAYSSHDYNNSDNTSSDDEIEDERTNITVDNSRDLYSKSLLTVTESSRVLVRLARTLNLNKSGVEHLLDSVRSLLPSENHLPRTFSGLLRSSQIESSTKVSYYCTECMKLLPSPQDPHCGPRCTLNGQNRASIHVAEFVAFNVERQIKSVAECYFSIIEEYSVNSSVLPADIPNGQMFNKLPKHSSTNRTLTICLQTDGAPLVKVGTKSIWPIQATLVEVPPPLRDRTNAVMVLGAWLAAGHPNRYIFWTRIVEQLQILHQDGILIHTPKGTTEHFGVRTQFILFDLPAMALHLNVKQFNGYDACPSCKIHGVLLANREIFYPHTKETIDPKTHHDYLRFGRGNYPQTTCFGILGSTPLSKILLLPTQVPKDYMHLVAGGHMRWLLSMWDRILLSDFIENGDKYLKQVVLPHSFKYQFIPFSHFSTWKTKMFRDFLLYVAPVFCVLFVPDKYALHFLLYFVYVRTLHFFTDVSELDGLEEHFDNYHQRMEDLYGPRSLLCSLHMHVHLVDQVRLHGCLGMTSCFARESYLSHVLRLCHGTRKLLQQFVFWYEIDQSLRPTNHLSMDDIFFKEHIFDKAYLNVKLFEKYRTIFYATVCEKKLSTQHPAVSEIFCRFTRGLSMFHSQAYTRGGLSISYRVALRNDVCRLSPHYCYAEIMFYFMIDSKRFAFVKISKCLSKSLVGGLPCSRDLQARVDRFYRFCSDENFSFDIVPVSEVLCKAIRLPLLEGPIFCFTPVHFDLEHD